MGVLRLVSRSVGRSPVSALAVVGLAAPVIGLVTLGLALYDAVAWRQVPLAGAPGTVVVYGSRTGPRDVQSRVAWSFPRLQFVRDRLTSLDLVTAWRPASVTLSGDGAPQVIAGEIVSSTYFDLMRVTPLRGRSFAPDDDLAGAPRPVVVVSDRFVARRRIAGVTIDLGSELTLNGRTVAVIGILPDSFRGLTNAADLWLPTAMAPVVSYPEFLTTNQDFITLLARLRPKESPESASREVASLTAAAYRAVPSDEVTGEVIVGGHVMPLSDARVRPEGARAARLVLGAASVLGLLIFSNLVTLLIGRVGARRRESAVALAIGSSSARLWRQHALDAGWLVAAGALVAASLLWVLLSIASPLDPFATIGRAFFSSFSQVVFDARFVAWWATVSCVVIALASTVPATWAMRRVSLDDLRAGARGSADSGLTRRRPGLAAAMLAVEAALAVVLVGAAAQLLVSYIQVQSAAVGVEPERVLTFELQPSERMVPTAEAAGFIDRVLTEIRQVPGVMSVSVDGGAPLAGSASTGLHVIGIADPPTGPPTVLRHYVGSEHFATLGIPLVSGRTFTDADRVGAPRVVVISQSAARRFFPDGNALGQRVWFTGSTMTSPNESGEIVGIVTDVKYDPLLGERTMASFYTPYRQFTYGWRVYFVKVTGEPRGFERAIASAIGRVAPDLPLLNVRPLTDVLVQSNRLSRRAAEGTGVLALVGLLLAASGLWAIVSHATAQRTREVAIRIAHGATAARVVAMVLADALRWPLVGLVAGVLLALTGSGVLGAVLYGVMPGSPHIVGLGAVVFALTAVLACLWPAMRAARTDPIQALRAD